MDEKPYSEKDLRAGFQFGRYRTLINQSMFEAIKKDNLPEKLKTLESQKENIKGIKVLLKEYPNSEFFKETYGELEEKAEHLGFKLTSEGLFLNEIKDPQS